MAATPRALKQWCLNKMETITSFLENWRQNLVYTLSLDAQFNPFLQNQPPLRLHQWWFFNTGGTPPYRSVSMLELMLGQIANYCPVISRNTFIKNSTSMGYIWSAIHLHFGFEATGMHVLDCLEIHLQLGEGPEDLYQRLMAFTEDNLLRSNSIQHHGALLTEYEADA